MAQQQSKQKVELSFFVRVQNTGTPNMVTQCYMKKFEGTNIQELMAQFNTAFTVWLSQHGYGTSGAQVVPPCPLCSAPMKLKNGKFGPFYSCTQWHATKCPGIRNADGTTSWKIKQILKQQGKQEAGTTVAAPVTPNKPIETKVDEVEDLVNSLDLDELNP